MYLEVLSNAYWCKSQWWAAFDFCGGWMCENLSLDSRGCISPGKGSEEAKQGKWSMSVFQWVRNRGRVGPWQQSCSGMERSGGCWKVLGEREHHTVFKAEVMD